MTSLLSQIDWRALLDSCSPEEYQELVLVPIQRALEIMAPKGNTPLLIYLGKIIIVRSTIVELKLLGVELEVSFLDRNLFITAHSQPLALKDILHSSTAPLTLEFIAQRSIGCDVPRIVIELEFLH